MGRIRHPISVLSQKLSRILAGQRGEPIAQDCDVLLGSVLHDLAPVPHLAEMTIDLLQHRRRGGPSSLLTA